MSQDPFSSVLSLVNTQSVVAGGFWAGGDWAISFPPPDRVKFFIAARGECWLTIDDDAPIRFRQGDVFLVTADRAFSLASDPALTPLDADSVFSNCAGNIIQLGTGLDFLLLGGHVQLDSGSGQLLVANLPTTIYLQAGRVEATALQWLIDQLVHEQLSGLAGADFAATQLAQLMFLQILRAYLDGAGPVMVGRLRALSDPRIAPAIRLMHDDPARAWGLIELARACAISRTAFAVYFKSVAGVAPLAYLTHWRMQLAERALRDGKASLAALSESLGYSSESAFSTAFKRVTGSAPQRYRAAAQRSAVAVQQSPG